METVRERGGERDGDSEREGGGGMETVRERGGERDGDSEREGGEGWRQ